MKQKILGHKIKFIFEKYESLMINYKRLKLKSQFKLLKVKYLLTSQFHVYTHLFLHYVGHTVLTI